MRIRNLFIGLGLFALALGGFGCAEKGRYETRYAAAGTPEIDLEEVLKLYKNFVRSDSRDLRDFEETINRRKLYQGEGQVTVREGGDGSVIGYVDQDGATGYDKKVDKLVFNLEVERRTNRIVASDRYHHHSSIDAGDILMLWWVSHMFNRQYGYYGRYPYYGYRYEPPGYYRRTVRQGSAGRGRQFRGRGSRAGK